ncbi:Npun_R2821/Npun_R2822 family protein [Brasilonema sp. UFV-L1]|uniref:Npun_R2821/Npun_R2822 family protein n=1 Tax=Brasilonema sp. UFV-L1 TaxID=2234130 RepID=UPI00145E70DB|nr:Npun_R2821/Npun_R2822 family protein [Brasilonema sp. UFV-L1]NMG09043.1 methionine synthase [Brasilonema sp. UFV-L1]
MEDFGIYTLANDIVYNQLVALLNSIEVNVSSKIPICIIPYDERLEQVKLEVSSRPNVTLFENKSSIQRWEDFYHQVWNAHPQASQLNQGHSKKWYKKSHLFRKMCAFDGKFERFVFYDADSLAMSSLDRVLEKLDDYDFVFDDWEHGKSTPVAALNFSVIEKAISLPESQVRPLLHCSSFFGSKQGIFGKDELEILREYLVKNQEFTWINERSWWCDADLFSYMTLRSHRPLFNFTLSPNGQDKTGNCADADPFVNINNVLYNQDGLKPIHRLHYMNYPAIDFTRLCQGEDVDIRYKNEFLYYRFLKQPEKRPQQLKPPSIPVKTNRFMKKVMSRIPRTIS